MVKTLRRTHGRKVLANYVADGPSSPVTTRTSITVRVVIKPRCIANDSQVGSNAKRGVVLGVVDASIVVRLKQIGKGGVIGVRLDGRGLIREKAQVVVRRLKLSRSRTRGLLLLRNSMGGMVSTGDRSFRQGAGSGWPVPGFEEKAKVGYAVLSILWVSRREKNPGDRIRPGD